jgi:hypothetical protein
MNEETEAQVGSVKPPKSTGTQQKTTVHAANHYFLSLIEVLWEKGNLFAIPMSQQVTNLGVK